MSPWLWLSVWILCVVGSLATHELAHVATALKLKWTYHGMMFKWYVLGVGVKLEPPSEEGHGKSLAAIAFAGPVGSALTAMLFLFLYDMHNSPVFSSLFYINLFIAFINLIPTPVTDGGHILKGLFDWEMKWRHAIAMWVGIELLLLILIILL